MMELSREIVEREIKGCKDVIERMEDGLLVNGLVKKYFEEELKKFPKPEKTEKKKPAGVG